MISSANRLLFLASLLACGAAAAQPSSRFATFENDAWFNTDRYYTNGIQYSVRHRDDAGPVLVKLCAWFACEGARVLATQSNFGQLMYTPSDIMVREAQPLDRPWAGLLYVERTATMLSADSRTLTTFAAQAGVTGPPSLSGPTQKLVHRIL